MDTSVPTISNPLQRAFLAAYVVYPVIATAAKHAGIDRGTHYLWMREDPAYPAAFAEAERQAGDSLEGVAVRRATKGLLEPVLYRGEVVKVIECDPETGEERAVPLMRRKIDNKVLLALLGRFKPEHYRTKKVEHTGEGGGPVEVSVKFV